MKRSILLVFTSVSLILFLGSQTTKVKGQVSNIFASQNLTVDPYGRVVDMIFDQDFALTAPWDRFRFDIDIVQPLTRDGGAFLGDLTGDGVADLVIASFTGETLFFPGKSGDLRQFGDGIYLKRTTASITEDPFYGNSGNWLSGDIGDLDGDGTKEIMIGRDIFANVGTLAEPVLDYQMTLSGDFWDPAASIGDLNGDDKPDVIVSNSYTGGLWVHWNNSTPGVFSFTAVLLYIFPSNSGRDNHLSLGDLNGDGLLDLAGPAGIYFNTGSAGVPSFNFTSPSAWNKSGGPDWLATSDQPPHVFLIDADGDGKLDAYVSNLSSTVWQVLFYKNIGTTSAHNLQYEGPVVAASSPLNFAYRGDEEPSFSPNHAFVATGDVDQNSLPDVLASDDGGTSFGVPAILWNFPLENGSGTHSLSYQDLYSYPALSQVNENCGNSSFFDPIDALCRPPNLFSVWTDLTGDGSPDALRTDQWIDSYKLFRLSRTGTMPFTLGSESTILTSPSNTQAIGRGVAMIDVNLDGKLDLVTGAANGQLLYYRNTGTAGSFADPNTLTDSGGITIDLGDNSWPTSIDLDGDNDLDLLVVTGDGKIHKVLCLTPGTEQGYSDGGLLGTPEQNPVNIVHTTGEDQSITTLDIDGDNLQDVILADTSGRVWLLRNIGSSASASFSLRGLNISRTTAAYVEIINPRQIRLYFSLPTIAGQTKIAYHNLPVTGGLPLSGQVILGSSPFSKLSPTNASINVSTSPSITWDVSNGATSYEYCYDTIPGGTCEDVWTSTGLNTFANLSGLNTSTTYYWQARARVGGGFTEADSGTWYSFTTVPPAPGSFGKSGPTDKATGIPINPTLSWSASSNATSFDYCYDTSNNNTCNNSWTSVENNTLIGLTGLNTSTTYYWQVRANNAGGTTYSNGSSTAFWSFTTTTVHNLFLPLILR